MYKYIMMCVLGLSLGCGCPATDNSNTDISPPDPGFDFSFTGCINDNDCLEHGGGCGTDVCSWDNPSVHVCVPADAGVESSWCGDPNLPQTFADMTCKCHDQGATCDTVSNHCSFISPQQ